MARRHGEGEPGDEVADTLVAPAEPGEPEREAPALVDVDPGHYEMGGEVARGGMGVVRRARDLRAQREVALKELLGGSEKLRVRFEREARITAQLQHPSIVPVYEVGQWPDGRPFYAMKLVGGRPLDDVVDEALDPDARLALVPRILPAVEAIAYAHEQGVIHRDLKPANVLLGEFGETVVIDWGIARFMDEPEEAPTPEASDAAGDERATTGKRPSSLGAGRRSSKLTVEGAVVGTPGYMPPEQAMGRPVDARADVYALGALLYHALSGEPPYDGTDVQAILVELLTEPPVPLATRAPSAPSDLIGIVEKAMARDPADRYADARELARDLEAFTTGRLVGAYRYSSWELITRFVRRNPALTAALAILAASAVAFAVAIVAAQRESERERARAVEAEQRALNQERVAHERLAQVHAQEAVRRLQRGDLLGAEVLAAGALLEQPANPASPHHALAPALPPDVRAARLAGPAATWSAARALRFASHERVLSAHTDWIYDTLASDDGRWLVTTGADRRAIIWDARDGGVHRELEGHTGTVFQAALDREGATLATSGYDGTVRLWSFPDGRPIRTLEHPTDRVYGVCFAHDGSLIAAGLEGRVAVFDPASGAVTRELQLTSALPWRLDCARDAPVAVAGTSGSEAVVLDLGAGAVRHRLMHGGSYVHCAILDPGGRVVTVDKQGVLRRFDPISGAVLAQAQVGGACEALAGSPDGRWLAIGWDEITVVDAATFRPVARLEGHRSIVVALSFDASGRRLYSGGEDRRVGSWAIPSARAGLALPTPTAAEIDTIRVSPNGRRLASVGDDGVVRLWDLETGREALALEGHSAPIRGLLWRDDAQLITSAMDLTLRTHDVGRAETTSVVTLPHFGDELARGADLTTLAIGSGDGSVLLEAPERGERRVLEVFGERAWWVGFDPAGRRLAAASYDGSVALIDPRAGEVVNRWSGHEARIYDADWRPDGEELTTGDLDGWVRGWDPETGERVRQWRARDGERVISLAWSADARWLLVTTDEGMRVHHPDGTLALRLDLGARTTAAAWTTDGRMIFASEGRVHVLPLDTESWRADPEALLAEAEAAAGATLDALIGLADDAP